VLKCFPLGVCFALLSYAYAQTCPTREDQLPEEKAPVDRVTFLGADLLPNEMQWQIAEQIRRGTRVVWEKEDVSALADEAAERTRAAYQNKGYFKVEVTGLAVRAIEDTELYDLVVRVSGQGKRYRLGDLTFSQATVFSTSKLRDLFPIKRGDIFSRDKIVEGLEKIRRLYLSDGYINLTAVPSTGFDEAHSVIDLEVNIDQGKQFRVRSIEVLGADEDAKSRILKDLALKPGDVYNSGVLERSLRKFPGMSAYDPNTVAKKLDEQSSRVDIALNFGDAMVCRSAEDGCELKSVLDWCAVAGK
jgi:outer membrane protein assembly factor BamA